MNQLAIIPKVAITIRPATMDDLPFMDRLQKKYNKALGFFPRAQMEGYIQAGGVLVAEGIEPQRRGGTEANLIAPDALTKQPSQQGVDSQEQSQQCLSASVSRCLRGYIISKDRYLKRDELGVIFQLCVNPDTQRKLVGAALVQAAFDRSAYGCRLYCCWCAQDLEANYFWESMGFVPVAFRAGSTGKRRVHIFWQKRIVEGDSETKWWYPCQTSSGAIRADRLVFPIPPGVHWSEVKAIEPRRSGDTEAVPVGSDGLANPSSGSKVGLVKRSRKSSSTSVPQCLRGKPAEPKLPGVTLQRWGAAPPPAVPSQTPAVPTPTPTKPARAPSRRRAEPAKIDAKFITAARELRDRYLEQINQNPALLEAPTKYSLLRVLPPTTTQTLPSLPAPLAA